MTLMLLTMNNFFVLLHPIQQLRRAAGGREGEPAMCLFSVCAPPRAAALRGRGLETMVLGASLSLHEKY